jgi:selenocysteine lyase/cysteine desulfurase
MSDRLPLAAAADTFPVLAQTVHGQPLAYLDNAATTQSPQPVLAAMRHFEAHDRANIHRGVHTLSQRATDAFEQARSTLKPMSAPMPARTGVHLGHDRGAQPRGRMACRTPGPGGP